jgi:hypothetical protein
MVKIDVIIKWSKKLYNNFLFCNCNLRFVIYISSKYSLKLIKKINLLLLASSTLDIDLCKCKLSKLLKIIYNSFVYIVISWIKKNFEGCSGLCFLSTIKIEVGQKHKMNDSLEACKSFFIKNLRSNLIYWWSHEPNHRFIL